MTENKDKQSDKEKEKEKDCVDKLSPLEKSTEKSHDKDKDQHDRYKKLSALMEILPLHATRVSTARGTTTQLLQLPQQQHRMPLGEEMVRSSGSGSSLYRSQCISFQSELLLLDVASGELSDLSVERLHHKDEFGTQRVYKKTSPNCVLTLYLPSREIMLAGSSPSILRGIVFVDPKSVQGYRVYAQLTLTFRYGREDEEVMGLRFCNEAIMSLHQVWPRSEEPAQSSLSPLQEALVRRLGDGAHPFTLTLTSQAPPSVQLVPAKRYYGAPIGTSYDVRCFIADKTDEKFHRRASVKMGVRVIYRTDVFHHAIGPENFAALINSQATSPPTSAALSTPPAGQETTTPGSSTSTGGTTSCIDSPKGVISSSEATGSSGSNHSAPPTGGSGAGGSCIKPRKSERGESFPKLRLSPKSFRFSGRFGRSKSEIEKCPNDPFYNYSKSFQEYDCSSGGGPQGSVDKPFLLQDGRVGLRASLDKAWYSHGEDVCVTVNIRNDSRKTVRKVRVSAIQHVDVCMFNNGKFKNVVADSDTSSPVDRTVLPGGTLSTTIVLKPQRGPTKNWIALEDTLQRCTEPDQITGVIAASAIRSPNLAMPPGHSINPCHSPAIGIPQPPHYHGHGHGHHAGGLGSGGSGGGHGGGGGGDDRNVFAIYVSYYVKVKLTLSGMGGELSLKLPFVLVHVDETQRAAAGELRVEKLALDDVPANKKNGNKAKTVAVEGERDLKLTPTLDRIESIDDELNICVPVPVPVPVPQPVPAVSEALSNGANKRRLIRSETIAKDLDEETEDQIRTEDTEPQAQLTTQSAEVAPPKDADEAVASTSNVELEHVHVVQIHTKQPADELQLETTDKSSTEIKVEAESESAPAAIVAADIQPSVSAEKSNDTHDESTGSLV